MRMSGLRFGMAIAALGALGCHGNSGSANAAGPDGSSLAEGGAGAVGTGSGGGTGGAAAVAGTGGEAGVAGGAAGRGGPGAVGAAGAAGGSAPTTFSLAAPRNWPIDVKWDGKGFSVGDLNNDGKADLALASNVGIAVLLGRGDLDFAAAVDYEAGYPTADPEGAVAVGDLNGDQVPDLVLVAAGYATVLVNRGDGTFLPGADYGYAEGTSSSGVAIGDLTGDGKADLVAASSDFGSVSVLVNRGDGTFSPPVAYYTDGEVKSLALADLNGDGLLDLAVGNAQTMIEGSPMTASGVLVYLGTGHGTFATPTAYATGTDAVSVAIGDLNGDGKPDVAFADRSSNVYVLNNTGSGTFGSAVRYLVGFVAAPLTAGFDDVQDEPVIAVGDLNGDRKPDLVLEAHSVSVFMNGGDGTLNTTTFGTYVAGNAQALELADVTGDGSLDLVTASAAGYVTVLVNDRNGAFSAGIVPDASISGNSLVLADLNADGKLDAVTAEQTGFLSGAIRVILGKGDGTFATPVDYTATYVMSAVAVGDLNGDGAPDLIGTSARALQVGKSNVDVFLNNKDGTFGAAVPYAPTARSVAITGTVLVDLNGDGRPDLGMLSNRGQVLVMLNAGDGTLAAPVAYPTSVPSPSCLADGDINGDGKVDLVTGCGTGDDTADVLLNNGDGTFAPATPISLIGMFASDLSVNDLNGDGKPEIVATGSALDAASGAQFDGIRVLPNTGGGVFGPPVDYPFEQSLLAAPIFGDVDGDGNVDMVVSANGSLRVFLNDGRGRFSRATYAYTVSGAGLVLGDLNGDGRLDFMYTNGQVILNASH